MRSRAVLLLVVATAFVAGCSRGKADPVTTTSVPRTTSTTSTSTTTTLEPVPEITTPTFAPPPVQPRARKATDRCADPSGTDYCVWGTMPVELTVNNSRVSSFSTNMRQSFTATSDATESIALRIGAVDAGGFVAAPEGSMPEEACVGLVLRTPTGVSIARTHLAATTQQTSLELVEVPLASGLIPGARYVLEVRSLPGCAGRRLSAMVAMDSQWKYPHEHGKLTIDGRPSVGSLWARIG